MRRAIAVPRNIDERPPAGVELLGSVFGAVPNDGAQHQLQEPAGVPSIAPSPLYGVRVKRVRVEWQQLDLTVPPPLVLRVVVNGAIGVGFNSLNYVPLQALAIGTPAMEFTVHGLLAPGASVRVFVANTGVVNPQYVAAFFWGWSIPIGLVDGDAYAS